MEENIPNYILYGEYDDRLFPDYLHIESIRARSIQNGWRFRPHQHHNLHQFFYILNGGGKAQIEQREFELVDQHIISIPPLVVHGFKFTPDTEGWVLSIPDVYLRNILKEETNLINHFASEFEFLCDDIELQIELTQVFSSIEKEHGDIHAVRNFTLKSQVSLLISKIMKSNPKLGLHNCKTEVKKQAILRLFQTQINENFKNRWSVAEYAESLNITPTHLNRLCRSSLEKSASDLINERTLLEARRLLIYTNKSITDISFELGYNDLAHFSKFFHNKTGKKPTDYRKDFIEGHNIS